VSVDIYVTATKRTLVANVGITYNLGPMLRAAGMDWEDFKRLEPADLTRRIAATIAELESRPERYRTFNPANGWGSYEVLIKSLGQVLAVLSDPENGDPKVTCL
jgi:hypothetical protein